jgi:1,4-dihydroxy-2-naphthoate octaprenyltransferase
LDDSPKTKTTRRASLLRFFVGGVLPAGTAKLLGLHPLGMLLLIFCRGVIPVLAITTLQSNDFPHFSNSFWKCPGQTG